MVAMTSRTFNKNNHVLVRKHLTQKTNHSNTKYNKQVFGVGDSENSDLIDAAIDVAVKAGVALNAQNIVVMSDRGSAILKSVPSKLPLAIHVYCAVHLCRNLEEKKIPRCFTYLFWAARNAESLYAHEVAMENMKEECPNMFSYLSAINGVWAIHSLIANDIPIYEIQSSNSVEQVFGLPVILEGRKQLPVTLLNTMLTWHFDSLTVNYQAIGNLQERVSKYLH